MFPLRYPLILASESPRREQILRMLGFDFSVSPSGVEETVPPDLKPEQVTETLARSKALPVSRERKEALVIGADTIVVLDNRILGKPSNPGEALEMLRFLSGHTHLVYTGVALARAGMVIGAGAECSEVTFAAWGDAELKAYIQSGEPMDKAGAYAVQGRGAFLVEGIRGCFFNVMGLPVQMTLRLLSPFRVT
jgi:septum formation protein